MRVVEPSDAQRLADLHGQAFDAPWDAAAFTGLLDTGAFGIIADNGFILCRAGGGEAEILTLAVSPHARKMGIGRALVEAAAGGAALGGASTLFLEVAADNAPALALYRAARFEQTGLRRGYYRRANMQLIDAIIFVRSLNRD